MERTDFDIDYDSQGLTRSVPRRLLTEQEKEWINAILQTNKRWADVALGNLCRRGMHMWLSHGAFGTSTTAAEWQNRASVP